MKWDGLKNLSRPLSDVDLRTMADYAKERTGACVSRWAPDRELVHRFSEVAFEALLNRACQKAWVWCAQHHTAPEVTPESALQSNMNLWKWWVPFHVDGKLHYGPEADTPFEAVLGAMGEFKCR